MGIGAVSIVFAILIISIQLYFFRKLSLLSLQTWSRQKAIDAALQVLEQKFQLDADIKARRKILENKTVDLQEFLNDLTEHGCGLLRIDPDAVLIRGYRK